MKKLILSLAMLVTIASASAQDIAVHRNELGSGTPGMSGAEVADRWSNDIYHAPQYMPNFPTAATIWPRVIDVDCEQNGPNLDCNGYNWTPNMGRAEYLMIRPRVRAAVAAPVIVVPPTVIERHYIREVERKRPRE